MKAFIRHISYYLPGKKLRNEELSSLFPEWDAENIFERTGIRERSISAEGELSSDMSVNAAETLFASHPINRSEIDFLLFCNQLPDYIVPPAACIIQDRLALSKNIGALDINLGCTGFVYCLSLAKGLVESGMAKNVLLLNGEMITKLIHPGDKSSRLLFGDAATATLIGTRDREGIGNFVFGTDGSRSNLMMIKVGGSRYPAYGYSSFPEYKDEYGNVSSDKHFQMKGTRVFTFSVEVAPKMIHELLEQTKQTIDDIDYFIFHQANLFVLQTLRRKLKIPEEKFCVNLSHTGNTVSCTIPIALCDSINAGKVKEGDKVMLVSFGTGLSWSATTIIV